MVKHYYKILEISPTASGNEIKKAYHQLALIYHPDVSKKKNAHELFTELNEAYQVLSDDTKREKYDRLYQRLFVEKDRTDQWETKEESLKDIYEWAKKAREKAREEAKQRFRDFIKTQPDFFNEKEMADGEPYNFNLHKTTNYQSKGFPFSRIRYRYLTIPIPRGRKSFVLHQVGLGIKIVFMALFIILSFTPYLFTDFLLGSLAGGMVIHLVYKAFHTKSIFYYARQHPLVKQYLKKGYNRGPHAAISNTLFAVVYYPSKWIF